MDIFDRIASEYQKSQPLRLRRDYGEVSQEGHSFKQAQMTKEKFKKRMEEDPEFAEKWNAQTVHSKEEMDEKLGRKAGDIFDKIASDFKQARMTKEKFKKRMEEDPEFAEKWNAQTVHSKEEMDEKLGRKAGHYHKGPYMSIQHILEMRDLVDGISEMIHRGDDIPDWAEDVGIKTIEGDSPGSSYYAAVLEKDIDEANSIAKKNNYPVKFVI